MEDLETIGVVIRKEKEFFITLFVIEEDDYHIDVSKLQPVDNYDGLFDELPETSAALVKVILDSNHSIRVELISVMDLINETEPGNNDGMTFYEDLCKDEHLRAVLFELCEERYRQLKELSEESTFSIGEPMPAHFSKGVEI